MTGAVAPYPKLQFLDQNGAPYAFGKVFTYAAGTSTPLATYTDATLSVANPNPVILDAAGRADIWIGAPAYKFVLQDTFNDIIWTEDNLQSSAGAQTFQLTASGSVVRTNNSKMSDWFGPKDFGALGDGATDDSAAFQKYQTAYPNGGGYLPAGNYVLKSNVTITGPMTFGPQAIIQPSTGFTFTMNHAIAAADYQIFSNVGGGTVSLNNEACNLRAAWFGILPQNTAAANTAAFNFMIASLPTTNGSRIMWPVGQINCNGFSHSRSGMYMEGAPEGTWIVNNTTNQFALEALGTGNFENEFRNFRIGQASGVVPVSGNGGVHIQSQLTKVFNIHCFNFPSALFDGVYVDGVVAGWLSNSNCSSLLGNGFHFGNGTGDIMIDKLYAVGNGQNGFYFNGSSGIYLQNSSCFSNSGSAFYFDNVGHANGSGTINEFFFGTNLIGDTSGGANWNMLNLNDSTLTGCWGSTQISHTVNTLAAGYNITGSGCNELTFTGCLALTNNGDGFLVDQSATNIRFIGCEARGNGLGGNAGVNNGFHLGLGAAVTNVTMLGCRARNNTGGIFLGTFASDYIIISSCNTQGNSGAGLVNNSTGTHNQIGTGANV